jgi:3-phenylpropionate/cinnamic acid dioxygenase small subunit
MPGHEHAEAIRKLLAEYGRLLDARDPHGWAALFGNDGEWVGGTRYGAISGPDALARFVSDEFGSTPPSVHIFGNMAIDVDGDAATAWSRWMLLEQAGDGVKIVLAGHYDDKLRRTPAGWRFARREVHVDLPQGV